jgi:UDP-2,3-diacylglucosamine pyrophosphatase LpxH
MQKIEGPWRDDVKAMKNAGKSWNEIAKEVPLKYPDVFAGLDYGQCFERVRQVTRRDEKQQQPVNVQEALMKALTKGTTSKELADALGISEKMAALMIDEKKQAGYNVREINGLWKILNDIIPSENHFENEWNGEKVIRFGLMGDTQINSKYTQITHLHKLYDFYAKEGIKVVYHNGDIDEGEQMRKGHQYEIHNQGVDDHKEEIVRVYPRREGIETRFITGNHDASMIKLAGVDIGRMISAERPDMKYLGQDSAVIHLTDNCNLELCHPGDGTAYAMSYKVQKRIEAMSGGEKPNVLAIGHYHKAEYIPEYRNVHAFQTGCLQAQTPFMRGKGISAMIGGWIVELHLNVDGAIESLTSSFRSFYTAIKDDYKNLR